MRLAIYGLTGFLGGNIANFLKDKYEIFGFGNRKDISDFAEINQSKYFTFNSKNHISLLDTVKPDCIVFCISLDHNKTDFSYIKSTIPD